MNKTQLISEISSESRLTKVDSKKALDAFLNVAGKTLKKGEKITLVGYGTFSVVKRAARIGRDPRTQKAIKIPAKRVVKFKAGADLASKVRQ